MTNNNPLNLNLKEESHNKTIKFTTPEPLQNTQGIKKKNPLMKIAIYLGIFFIVSLAVFSTQVVMSNQNSHSIFSSLPGIKQLKNLAESSQKLLKGEERDRINVLLLGIGGKGHNGGLLTDTIIVASLKPSTKEVAMLSIPRDMTVPIEGMGWRKINSVHALAEKKQTGTGGLAISQTVSDTLNMPIDYYFTIDFAGFAKIIDQIGGIDVDVENTLDDYSYPVLGREDAYPYNSRWEHLHVEKGRQTMDGSLALKFARSRHGINGEGSDFARAKRQQKIIEAVKEKILSKNIVFWPKMIADIIGTISEHMDTNLKIWEMAKLWEIFKDIKKENIINKVLDDSQDGLLVSGRGEEGAYILTPRNGDFTEIQYYANNVFSNVSEKIKEKVSTEKAKLEIRNGTWINGLASKIAVDLEKYGLTITSLANADQQNYQHSVIYDFSGNTKNESLTILKEKTNANVSPEIPEWLNKIINTYSSEKKPDFILILGRDADKTSSGAENTIK